MVEKEEAKLMDIDYAEWEKEYDSEHEYIKQAEADEIKLQKALAMARIAHEGQTRDDGSPYFNHIEGVIRILKEEFKCSGTTLIIAALHDVIEDSAITEEEIKKAFGRVVSEGVRVLTKEKGMTVKEYFTNIDNFEFDSFAWIVKIADRIYNVRDLKTIVESNPAKVKKYIEETEKYYIPKSKLFQRMCKETLEEAVMEVKNILRNNN